MAKIYGLNGNISGKQGNNVFAILRGETILRKYQPIVANPNTQPQVQQRAKFKVASQMASILPANILSGLAPLSRQRNVALRNAFTVANFEAGSVRYEQGKGTFFMPSMVFSRGNLPMGSFAAPDFEESLEVQASFTNPGLDILTGSKKVLMFAFAPALKQYYAGELIDASTGSAIIDFPAGWAGVLVHVWAYFIRTASETADVRYTSAFAAGASFSVTPEFVQAAGAMEYSNTIYVGTGTIS